MDIEFVPVTQQNVSVALSLHVFPKQDHMVESVEQCLKDATEFPLWHPVIIFAGDIAIGFSMYGLWPVAGKDGHVWMDRFLIDEHYQGHGFSKLALSQLLDLIKNKYNCKTIYLSVYANNAVAIHLYESMGFRFNGELDINGEHVMVIDV